MNISQIDQIKENAPKAARLLKTLANPARLTVLCQLVEGERCAGDLWADSNLSQSAFSQHLAVLRKNRYVSIRKEAQTVYYSLSDKRCIAILQTLKDIFCTD